MGSRDLHLRQTSKARILALGMALATVVTLRPAHGDPGDMFTSSAPVIGADQPKAADIRDGDASVATQTGALQYSYPIQVPPGRHGMQPHLALSYSSQAPVYGGIAAGWSLSIPEIRDDTSMGRLRTQTTGVSNTFVSTLAGGRELVQVFTDLAPPRTGTYRAQNDSTFARYQRTPTRWTVLTPDGTTNIFGDANFISCPNISNGNAPLTQTIDAFGNRVDYFWTAHAGSTYQSNDCHIDHIQYGANATAGLPHFAQVAFTYDSPRPTPCANIEVGSATDYRQGFMHVTGSGKLNAITVTAFDTSGTVHTRQISLNYDPNPESCTNAVAAFKQLERISKTAQQNDRRCELQEPKEVLDLVLVAGHQPA